MKKLSKFLCITLILVLMLSMVAGISVKASETEPLTEYNATAPEDTEPETEEPMLEVIPSITEEAASDISALLSTKATFDDGKYRQKAVIWTVNGESVEYTYNGKDNNYNQLLMHTLWYKDEWRAAYCIEPGKTVFVNSDYDEEENSGVDPWGQLPFAKQRGVSLTLLYGYPNGLDSDDLKTQIAYQLATYLIVHEIILGWRQDVHPFARTNDHYFDVFGGGTPDKPEKLQITSEFYSTVHEKFLNSEDIWYAYNHISNKLATHDLVPSFASKLKSQAPTHTMKSNGDGTYSITLTDTNNILASYDFTNTDDLKFKKSSDGKSLTITTSNKTLGTITVSPTRDLPSVDNSAFLIWNSETNSQELCSLKAASDDPVPAYFKVKLPLGKLTITKTTEDDKNVDGWQFNIYSNAACTKKISGPHTTNNKGKVTITGLESGTVWVKEIGHEDSNMLTIYECVTTAKDVTITAGATSTVTFNNKLIPPGKIVVTKTTSDNKNLAGWQFGLYADKACTDLIESGTTNSAGKVTFLDVMPSTVWIKELGHTTGSISVLYTCDSDNPQKVTVKADTTSNVSFVNTLLPPGKIIVTKTTSDNKHLSGWQFGLYSNKACTDLIAEATTNSSGKATFPSVEHGDVWVKELGNTNSSVAVLYECTSTNPQKVTVKRNQTSTLTFENTFLPPGKIVITKTTSDGKNLSGWQFGLYSEKACTNLLATATTNSSGEATFPSVEHGDVWVKELGNTKSSVTVLYECSSTNPQKVTVKRNQTSTLTFENTFIPPGKIVITKTTSDGKNLSGWQFGLYSEKACTNLLATATTNSSGEATFPSVEHGDVWVKELGNAKSSVTVLYECSSTNPQKVTVQRNKTSKVTFENELLPPGNVSIMKTTSDQKNLSGWQFNIYSDRTCTKLISGPHTSGSDGQIVVSDLSPGTIWVKEIGHTNANILAQYSCFSTNPQEVQIISEQTSNVNFHNTLRPPGSITIKKVTEDGNNLGGWEFGIYTDEACTELSYGPYTTNPGGYLTCENIRPGTYWVKELENTNLDITLKYQCDSTKPQRIFITSGETSELEFHNVFSPPGNVVIKKTCDSGNDIGGWTFNFYRDAACTQLVSGPHVTDSDGSVTISDIVPGVYWIKEVGNTNKTIEIRYRNGSANPLKTAVLPDETVEAAFYNLMLPPGTIIISKTTEDTKNLSGWQFALFADEKCKELVGGPYVTDDTGSVVIPSILAGTYWLQEIGHKNPILSEVYQCEGENPRRIEVTSGKSTSVHFVNSFAPPGTIELIKSTDTSGDLTGWIFCLYSDEECTQLLFNAGETDANGKLTVSGLHPGYYWIREEGNIDTSLNDLYQCGSTNPQYVRIYSGKSTVINFTNTTLPPGMLHIFKKTDDGANLKGWQFALYNDKACTQLAHGPFTTLADGSFVSTRIWQGTYWIKELGHEDPTINAQYKCSSDNPQQITVTSGMMTQVTFKNITVPKGSIKIIKTTSDRLYLDNWKFVIYADEACKEAIGGSYSTGADGTVTISDLTPGTVWIKEIGHTDPTITGYYTCVSYNPVKVTIMSNKTVEVHFRNDTVPDGSVHLIKTTNCGTGLNGWQFSLYSDNGCTKLVAGPYITDAKGTLDFPNLKPGVYWIKELGNEDPVKNELYICDSLNPQKVLIVSGRTSTVSFHNIILTGSITVSKTDPEGNTLPGAQFLLEWSNDGVNWKPVNYSDSLGIGTTSTQGVENGLQTTDEAGHISYAGLNPDLQYRLYEVKAPEGYQLLSDYVFQGKLTGSDLSVTVTVVNSPVYTLPHTGSNSMMDMSISIALCLLTCLFPIFYFRRKEN